MNKQLVKKSPPQKSVKQSKQSNAMSTRSQQAIVPYKPNQSFLDVPAAQGFLSGSGGPVFVAKSGKDLSVRIVNREFITDLSITAASFNSANVQALDINPGQPAVFPWLSNLAAQFEKYNFKNLCFHYRTMASTATAGKALFAIDLDVLDSVPSQKAQMLQNKIKADGPVWANFDMQVPKDDLARSKDKYVRVGAPIGADLKTYDLGEIFFMAIGPANSLVGELWVSYDVELITPQYQTIPSERFVAGTGVSAATPWGTNTPGAYFGNVLMSPVLNTNQITCNVPGQYLIDFGLTGTGIPTNTYPTVTVVSGAATVSNLNIASSGTNGICSQLITVTANSVLAWAFAGWLTTLTATSFRCTTYQASVG